VYVCVCVCVCVCARVRVCVCRCSLDSGSLIVVRWFCSQHHLFVYKVGQSRIYTPYMTVYLVISLPKIPYIHRIYIWFWPTLFIYPVLPCEFSRLGRLSCWHWKRTPKRSNTGSENRSPHKSRRKSHFLSPIYLPVCFLKVFPYYVSWTLSLQ
jgi:hypothetical protein